MIYGDGRGGKRARRVSHPGENHSRSDAYYKSRNQLRERYGTYALRQLLKHYFFRPLLLGWRASAGIATWDGILIIARVGLTALVLLVVLCEGILSARHHEGIARESVEIDFPLQGLQTTASAEDFENVKGNDAVSAKFSIRMATVDGIRMPAIGSILVDVIRTHQIKSMIDWPCRAHREIVPPALYLGMNVSTTRELDEAKFRYYCMDTDSGELAKTSYAIRDVVGRRRGLHFIRQRVQGSFRISKHAQAFSRTSMTGSLVAGNLHRSEDPSEQERRSFDAKLPRNSDEDSSASKSSASKASTLTDGSAAELIFSWGGRAGGPNASTEVKELVLSAAASSARFALIGAHAAYGTRWEKLSNTTGVVNDMTLGRFSGSRMPWFPFVNAIIFLSDEYSPPSEEISGGPRFLALYRLDAIPQVLVEKRRSELKTEGSQINLA